MFHMFTTRTKSKYLYHIKAAQSHHVHPVVRAFILLFHEMIKFFVLLFLNCDTEETILNLKNKPISLYCQFTHC